MGEEGGGRDSTGWVLSEPSLSYLEALPTKLRLTIDGVRFLLVHARPGTDMAGIREDGPSSSVLEGWFEDYEADVLIVGHTHTPLVRSVGDGKRVLNPGTLMREPADAVEAPMLFDRATGKFVRREPELGTFGVFDTRTRKYSVRRLGPGKR